MRRRSFLLSAVASALATVLPISLPAFAAAPAFDFRDLPIEKIERINDAFNVVEAYRFELKEKVELFGLNPQRIHTIAELRNRVLDFVLDYGSYDVWDRIVYLNTIRANLDERFGNDLGAHLHWMDHTRVSWPDTVRDVLKSGNMFDLRHVALSTIRG